MNSMMEEEAPKKELAGFFQYITRVRQEIDVISLTLLSKRPKAPPIKSCKLSSTKNLAERIAGRRNSWRKTV